MTRRHRARTQQATHQCPSCSYWFTAYGFTQHLAQTQRPACAALRVHAQGRQAGDSPASHSRSSSISSTRPSTPPASPPHSPTGGSASSHPPDHEDPENGPEQQFDSDFFGQYTAEDWEDFDEWAGEAEEEPESNTSGGGGDGDGSQVADDEEEADHFEEEHGWEPAVGQAQQHNGGQVGSGEEGNGHGDDSGSGEDENMDTAAGSASDSSPNDASERATHARAQEHLRRPKTFIVRFPGPHAGAPVNGQREQSPYDQYQHMTDVDGFNLYAPFTSRIDWEVAKWAKMRGPGSTAVTELLQIDDVSIDVSPALSIII